MDETGAMLSMLGSAKALIGRDDRLNDQGARVKRDMVMVTSADSRILAL